MLICAAAVGSRLALRRIKAAHLCGPNLRIKEGSLHRDSGVVARRTRPIKTKLTDVCGDPARTKCPVVPLSRRSNSVAPTRAAVVDGGAPRGSQVLALRDDGRRSFSFALANRSFAFADRCNDRGRRRRHVGGISLTAEFNRETRLHLHHRAGSQNGQTKSGCAGNAENLFHHLVGSPIPVREL
jgi:hypothetical protein